jgi:hypothetical protein
MVPVKKHKDIRKIIKDDNCGNVRRAISCRVTVIGQELKINSL